MKLLGIEVLAKAVLPQNDILVEVRIPNVATYHVNFVSENCYVKSSTRAEYTLTGWQIHKYLPNIDESMLTAHPRFGNVKRFYFGKDVVFLGNERMIIEIEYLDTRNGQVDTHIHPNHVREVYLNLEAPYDGRVCDYYQKHETYCNHTLAIKAYFVK